MTQQVQLSRGLVALVDDQDLARVTALGKWYADPSGRTFYARKNVWQGGRCVAVRMHRFLTGWDKVDHINGDGLDNRRSNLRPATASTNAMNRQRPRRRCATGYKGVYSNRWGWYAVITFEGRRTHLGSFKDPVEAAHAYDRAARELFGAFARPNFPEDPS